MSRQTSSSASTVGITDAFGNPITSTGGALDINMVPGSHIPTFVYNEVSSVAVGIETPISTHTAQIDSFIQKVSVSSSNVGEIRVYKNGVLIDKNYLSYLSFNVAFDYATGVSSSPGVKLIQGDILAVKGLNLGQDPCNFNAKLLIIEV